LSERYNRFDRSITSLRGRRRQNVIRRIELRWEEARERRGSLEPSHIEADAGRRSRLLGVADDEDLLGPRDHSTLGRRRQIILAMRSQARILSIIFTAPFGFGQTAPQGHMDPHFDPKSWAKSFDEPSRDAWQTPDRVMVALALQPGRRPCARRNRLRAASIYGADIEPEVVNCLRDRAAKG
jgi:hypothetical protein